MEIIKVTPTEDVFSISWMFNRYCNYECLYCKSNDHTNKQDFKTLEEYQQAWRNIYKNISKDKKIKLAFTGGELVTNKQFLPFIKWLRLNYKDSIRGIFVTTNGSASQRYYEELCEYVESICLSLHSEYVNETKFLNTAKSINKMLVRPEKSLHVKIMNETWNKDRFPLYEKFFKDNDIDYSICEIDYSETNRKIPLQQGVYDFEIQK